MDKFYFKTDKVVLRFILAFLVVVSVICKLASALKVDYLWLSLIAITGAYILLFLGRQLIAVIKNQPALIITDDYVYVFEARNALTFYLSGTYYWDDVEFFRKRVNVYTKSVEIGFKPEQATNRTKSIKSYLTRRLNVKFSISIINANQADIINCLDKHSMVILPD